MVHVRRGRLARSHTLSAGHLLDEKREPHFFSWHAWFKRWDDRMDLERLLLTPVRFRDHLVMKRLIRVLDPRPGDRVDPQW